ncbi:MAG: hypothetical protein M3135_00210 [Actinomycetota bacterium]|nr:hypothetical protein [Actinomycetota bacterium]
MAALGSDVLRRVAAWRTDDAPITSLYLDLDGRRRPRRAEYVRRAEDLTRRACEDSEGEDRRGFLSVRADRKRITSYVRDRLERRGSVRGLAAFSSSAAGLWEAVTLPRPVRDGVRIGPRPHLLPLESLFEVAETFCTAIVDREKARILISRLGRIEDVTSVLDEIPGRHDQGGWAQARHRRHIEDHVLRHLKHVAGALLRLHERHRFSHLVLAGPEETVAELERGLHDYVRRTILGHTSLSMAAPLSTVLERAVELEHVLGERRERQAVERLVQEVKTGTGRAASGMDETLLALEEGRVETLLIMSDLEASGARCSSCGHLSAAATRCPVCGGEVAPVPDLAEVAVEEALRGRCRVETVAASDELRGVGGIGALLRF